MTANLPKIVISVVGILAALVAARFVMTTTIFSWESCGKDDSHVIRMRAYSEIELTELYEELMSLRGKYPSMKLTRYSQSPIPDSLSKLHALYIDVSEPPGDVFVVLNKCNVSVGVKLFVRSGEIFGKKEMELSWRQPTHANPYNEESEILWSE